MSTSKIGTWHVFPKCTETSALGSWCSWVPGEGGSLLTVQWMENRGLLEKPKILFRAGVWPRNCKLSSGGVFLSHTHLSLWNLINALELVVALVSLYSQRRGGTCRRYSDKLRRFGPRGLKCSKLPECFYIAGFSLAEQIFLYDLTVSFIISKDSGTLKKVFLIKFHSDFFSFLSAIIAIRKGIKVHLCINLYGRTWGKSYLKSILYLKSHCGL